MIIVQIKGGLGNQLFQYAAGRSLALYKDVHLKLDISWFGKQSKRQYRLSHFKIAATVARPDEVAKLQGRNLRDVRARIFRFSQKCLPYYKRRVFKERSLYYDPLLFKARRDVYLVGYWGSEKYFADIKETIKNDLTIKDSWDDANREVYQRICEVDSISLHVRRQDYVQHKIFDTCPPDYYSQAMTLLIGRLNIPHLFVFSDDIEWARQNLNPWIPTTYVDHNGPERDHEDLRLISCCKYHIIANSTFSWWGAWLSPFQEKIVIVPKRWFRNMNLDIRDFLPENWIRI